MDRKRFVVTEAHLKLLPRLNIIFEDSIDWGGPGADGKRPYGGGDLYGDMCSILEVEVPTNSYGEPLYSKELLTKLEKLHKSMTEVLQILVRTGEVKAGVYETSRYGVNWEWVSENHG